MMAILAIAFNASSVYWSVRFIFFYPIHNVYLVYSYCYGLS